jgi:hypothetical protein
MVSSGRNTYEYILILNLLHLTDLTINSCIKRYNDSRGKLSLINTAHIKLPERKKKDFPWRSIPLSAGKAPSAGLYGPDDRKIRVRFPAGQKFFSELQTFWTLSKAYNSVIVSVTLHLQQSLEFTENFLFTLLPDWLWSLPNCCLGYERMDPQLSSNMSSWNHAKTRMRVCTGISLNARDV